MANFHMVKQKGQITLYAALGVGILLVGLTIAVKVQSSRLAACRAEFAAFEAQPPLLLTFRMAGPTVLDQERPDLTLEEFLARPVRTCGERLRLGNQGSNNDQQDNHEAGRGEGGHEVES